MNNNSNAAAKRKQIIYSEPQRVKVGTKTVTSKKGITSIVNIYKNNPNARPLKEIVHATIPAGGKDKLGNVIPAWNGFSSKIKASRR